MPRSGAIPYTATKPIPFSVTINNPIALAYANEPVGIRVRFPAGLVPTADYVRIVRDTGAFAEFQWEPSVEPINDTARGTWPDGSLREGTFWVNIASLAASATLEYVLQVYATAQSQSFTQLVTYTSVGGTDERFDTARIQLDFNTGKQWMPARYRDKNAASDNLFNGTQGIFTQAVIAGVTKSSFTVGDVTGNTKTRINTTNFGYGVVYQEFQVDWAWATEPTSFVRERFRVWANGSITRESKQYTTGVLASNARKMLSNVQTENTGMTGTYDTDRAYKEFVWSTKNMIAGIRTMSTQYPGWTTEAHATNFDGTGNNNQVLWGWTGTTGLISGAFFYQLTFYDLAYAAGDALNQWTRRLNPIYTWATPYNIGQMRENFVSMARDLISDFIPLSVADATDAYSGAEGLARLTISALDGTNVRAAVLTTYTDWTTARGITPSSAASYKTAWDGGLGWEFIGKSIEVLPWLRKAYIKAGDSVNQATVESYIHAVADATVQMEVSSGSDGSMKLDGGGTDNYNAESSAMCALAQSLAITADATRQTTYNRIATRYAAGYFATTKMPYSVAIGGQPNDSVKSPRSTYFAYAAFGQSLAHSFRPLAATPQSVRQYVYEFTSPSGIADEWRYQLQQIRRGLPNTLMYPMLCLAYSNPSASDWQWITSEIEYLYSKRRPGSGPQMQLENLTGTDATPVGAWVDVRALCEIVLTAIRGFE